MRSGLTLFISTLLMFYLYEPHLRDLVVPDPFFGWGAHAACLGFSWWAVGGMAAVNVGIGLEFLFIPSRSYLFRKNYSEHISPYGQENLRRLEMFVLFCGMAHILRPIVAFVPSMTIFLLGLDSFTLISAIRARTALQGMTAEAVVIVQKQEEVEQRYDEIAAQSEALATQRDQAILALRRINAQVNNLQEVSSRFSASSSEFLTSAERHLMSENLIGALVHIIESHPEAVVLYEMTDAKIVAASETFWRMIDHAPARDVEYLPLIAPDFRVTVAENSEERPLARDDVDYYDVAYVGSAGQRINVRHRAGFIEEDWVKSFTWCRAEIV